MRKITQILTAIFLLLSGAAYAQNKADILILNKEYSKALVELEKQINEKPSAQLYQKIGAIYENQQNYQKAISAYLNGLRFDEKNATLMGEAAGCFAILGNNHDAITYYKEAVASAPNNLVLAGKLGRVYINEKKYKVAYKVFTGIYERDSSNVYWNKQLAYCAYKNFDRKKAVHLYEKVIELNPRDHGSYINLIHAKKKKKEGGKIMSLIEKGLVQFPENPELLLEKATYYYKTKQYVEAADQYELFLKTQEDLLYETEMNYGIATYFAGRFDRALEIFSELMALNPNDPLVVYYKGLCFKRQKKYEDAEKYMQWAIEGSTPDYVAEMYHHLGQILGQQRKFKESIAALEKAHKIKPDKYEVLFEIATTYEEYNSNKTLALNYYNIYLKEAGEKAKNVNYALDRIERIKEDLFFEE